MAAPIVCACWQSLLQKDTRKRYYSMGIYSYQIDHSPRFQTSHPFLCCSVVLREDVIKITIIIIKCDRGQDNTRDNITKQHNTNTKAQQQLLELLHHRPKVFKTPAFLSPCSKSFFCGDRLRPGWDRLIHQRRGKRYANENG